MSENRLGNRRALQGIVAPFCYWTKCVCVCAHAVGGILHLLLSCERRSRWRSPTVATGALSARVCVKCSRKRVRRANNKRYESHARTAQATLARA